MLPSGTGTRLSAFDALTRALTQSGRNIGPPSPTASTVSPRTWLPLGVACVSRIQSQYIPHDHLTGAALWGNVPIDD